MWTIANDEHWQVASIMSITMKTVQIAKFQLQYDCDIDMVNMILTWSTC